MIKKDDEFGMQCRARTKAGKRCKRKVAFLSPMCISRENWLEALRTGWPRCWRGMKEPTMVRYGLCRQHGYKNLDHEGYFYLYGIGTVGGAKKDEKDPEYEAACSEGDRRIAEYAKQNAKRP